MGATTTRICRAAHWIALALAISAASAAVSEGTQQETQRQQQQTVVQQPDESPYLLISSTWSIYKMPINGSTNPQEIISESGILSVAFHYGMGKIFWVNSNMRCIKVANMDGSDKRTLVAGNIRAPADLAVDWINNKLYWSDSSLRRIEEYDLNTRERRIVIQFNSSSSPFGLALYPIAHHGILYWTDNSKLQRIITTGSSHAVVSQNLHCAIPLALNLRQRMVYWMSRCSHSMMSSSINGSNREVLVESDSTVVRFPRGMAELDNVVYWVQPTAVYKKTSSGMDLLFEGQSSNPLRDIQVVSWRSQPTLEELQEPETGSETVQPICGETCQNSGECVFPGLCECRVGWAGTSCSEDENECLVNNGGCQQLCVNTEGSFHCSCREGFSLSANGTSCIESVVTPTASVEATTHSLLSPEINPSRSVEPGLPILTTPSSSLSSLLPASSSPEPSFEPNSPTQSASLELPVQRSSQVASYTDSMPTSSSTLISNTRVTTVLYHPRPSSTPPSSGDSTTKVPTGNDVVSGALPTAASDSMDPDVYQTPLPTSDSASTNSRERPTLSGINDSEDEGTNPLVFIVPLSVVAGFILISLSMLMFALTYVYCRNQRQGSYSFKNPTALDIAGEVPTNTLVRGKVTRTSFRPIAPAQNSQETVAFLSQPRRSNDRSSSTISRSESFEWNNSNTDREIL